MKKLKPKQLGLIAVLVASIAFLFYTMTSSPPASGKKRRATHKALAAALPESARPAIAAAPADAEFGRYEIILKRDPFNLPKPPPPPQVKFLPPLQPRPAPPQPTPPPQPAPAPQPPSFPGWSYVGYIEINGKMMGILQNLSDRTVEYLAVGDGFRGATVTEVTATQISLKAGVAPPAVLARSQNFDLIPLDKGASGSQSRPGRPSPAAQPPRPT